jgi:biotin synthase
VGLDRSNTLGRIFDRDEIHRALDMEVCATLGMLNDEQALRLKAAGLTAYNHNLDTSREYYPNVGRG